MKSLKIFQHNIIVRMEKQIDHSDKENLLKLIKQAIEMLCEKNISEVVILSSYKINSVLKEEYWERTREKALLFYTDEKGADQKIKSL